MYSLVKVVILQLCVDMVTLTYALLDPAIRKLEPCIFMCVKSASISYMETLDIMAVTFAW